MDEYSPGEFALIFVLRILALACAISPALI
jgi:hypothetical protein